MPFCIGWVENFDGITLSCTVKKIEANSCFSIFGKNLKIQNGRHFWEKENFLKLPRVHLLDTLWIENFNKITLFCTVKASLCFSILGKNSKIQNGRHMWGGENFLKIAKSTFLRYPWIENFDEIALSRTVKEIEANLCFAIVGKNSKI